MNINETVIKKYKIVCITQIFNEIRKQNLERFWKYIQPVCDDLVVYDDGSTDGSYKYMSNKATYIIKGGKNDFKNEIHHKKLLLENALKLKPDFILWLDADEVLTANAKDELQKLCGYAIENKIDGISFHEINLWRSNSWKRVDNSYDEGWFVRLWRVTPDLAFDEPQLGLHQQQYPKSIKKVQKTERIKVIHYGFASDRSLAFKYLTYRSHGQSGWALERLLDESTLNLVKVDKKLFPDGLYINDDQPIPRTFTQAILSIDKYKEEVFKPRISIVCLIYKSTEWLKFVYEQVLRYTDLSDKEFYFVANDANESVLKYLSDNYIPHYIWNNTEEQRKEWYINNVYRAWNFAAQKAKGDYILFINSDMAFSNNWVENLFNKLNGKNCIASRLIESGKLLSGKHAISKDFGRVIEDYDEIAFIDYAEKIKVNKLEEGGLFMPLLIKKDDFLGIGGYPEGNIVPGSDIFNPIIAKQGTDCISGDVVLMKKLATKGIIHSTSFDSIVYHFQCGEMDSDSTEVNENKDVRLIICNDYLTGRMGEKTMWDFLLSGLPNSAGLDMDILKVDKDFEKEAKEYIRKNYPDNAIILQNASFIDLIDSERFNILYLQDNLRAMGRKSDQQEANIKRANILVTNSKITAAYYPEYDFEIIPIGIDDKLFKPLDKNIVRKEFDIPDSKIGIFVGDFSEVKGWSEIKKLIENHDEIFWILVSKDNNTFVRNNCKVFNRISQEKLVKLLNCADFFILGSPVETQCLSALEACFCNIPVIMRNTGIFADFTEEEKIQIGYFGDDFEEGLNIVLSKKFSPRDLMYEKKLTIEGMIEQWKNLISKARLKSEQIYMKNIDKKKSSYSLSELKNFSPNEIKQNFFSVIVPTYNQAEFLGEALDSLLAQTFPYWEAIIVNDGSTDNTKEVINKYLAIDKRFRAFHKENGGVASALNEGIKHAKGEWFCWLSSDDFYEPDKLEIHFNYIKSFPEIMFFYSHFYYYNDHTKEKTLPGLWFPIPPRIYQVSRFFKGNYVHGNSFAANKKVFDKVGLFDASLRQAQDFDMWLRISAKFETLYINRRTCITRVHPGQDTNAFPDGMYFDSARSCINFLNRHKLEEIFPLLDLRNHNDIILMIDEVLDLSTDVTAFMYRLGFMPILLDRLKEFIINHKLFNYLDYIDEYLNNVIKISKLNLPEPIINALKSFNQTKNFVFRPYDIYSNLLKIIDYYLSIGEQENAIKLEYYIHLLYNKRETRELDFVKKNKVYNYKILKPKNNVSKELPYSNWLKWKIEPLTYDGLFLQDLTILCPECGNKVRYKKEYYINNQPIKLNIVCPECHYAYFIDEARINKYLEAKSSETEKKQFKSPEAPTVAFISRGLSGRSGGTKIFSFYMQWLGANGIKTVVYSDSEEPKWFKVPGEFISIKDFSKIDFPPVNLVIVYNILDIAKIVDKIPLSKIVYVSQAYEGFLYGKNFKEMRTDKALFHSLHSLPIKIFCVSEHLYSFIKNNINNNVSFVPNFVNLNVFKQEINHNDKENIILFTGNPFQPLKGFEFLLSALKFIQKKYNNYKDFKLIVAVGIADERMINRISSLKRYFDFKIEFLHGLSDQMMKDLINLSKIYVCASWYEGFSLSILEAMACGTIVISTRNMGGESFCIDHYNSFLVDYGDVNKLAEYIYNIFEGKFDNYRIIKNAFETSRRYSLKNSYDKFFESLNKLLPEIKMSLPIKEDVIEYKSNEQKILPKNYPKLKITYLIDNLKSLTGGNLTLCCQVNYLLEKGHKVYIVSYTDFSNEIPYKAELIKVPEASSFVNFIPDCDVVVATYFTNANELKHVKERKKIYFVQGDQYIFDDERVTLSKNPSYDSNYFKKLSEEAYKIPNVNICVNSKGLANRIKEKYGISVNKIINIGVDRKVYRPTQKPYKNSLLKILIVGPDNYGTITEPLFFKGIGDAKEALLKLRNHFQNFNVVRISNTQPDIFKDFPCEFYYKPDDELKTFIYGTSDVLIYPSHYEAWGLPPLEAMSSGTAVICTKNLGSLEYCIDEENCLLVPIAAPDEIVKALLKLINEPGLKEKIINGGFVTAAKFSKQNELKVFEKYLLEVVFDNNLFKETLDNESISSIMTNNDIMCLEKNVYELLRSRNYYSAINDLLKLEVIYSSDLSQYKNDYLKTVIHLADLFTLTDNFSKAYQYYSICLEMSSNSIEALYGMAQLLFKQDKLLEAKDMLKKILEIKPFHPEAIQGIKEIDEILEAEQFQKRLAEDEDFKILTEAEEKIENNNYESAKELLNNLIQKNPNNIEALIDLGVVYIMTKEHRKAKDVYDKVLALDPYNDIALKNIKYLKDYLKN